jgi:mannose-1-phosphate guanylyltransferase
MAVASAVATAKSGWLTTIGIAPSRPETGYGYIERTDDLIPETGPLDAYAARRFIEKPDQDRARQFLQGGRHLWNASMFIWQVGVFQEQLARLQRDLHDAIEEIASFCWTGRPSVDCEERWASLPVLTIDEGLMELVGAFAVVPVDMRWSDVGDWESLAAFFEPDAAGNRGNGDRVGIDASNTMIWSTSDRLIAMLGVDNLAIIETDDAILVMDRARAQEVRSIVEALKERNDDRI